MKAFFVTILLFVCVSILAFTPTSAIVPTKNVSHTLAYFKKQSGLFAASTANLQLQISRIEQKNPASILQAREALKTCRRRYKTIEFFLEYFLFSASTVYNQPNKVEVEEPFMEFHEPLGLQVIEGLLFDKQAASKKQELSAQIELVHSSAADLNALLYNLKIDDRQILESLQLELIRIMTLGITGFDTPELKTGIIESGCALQSMKVILSSFLSEKSREADSVQNYLNEGLKLLLANPDFDSFDRMHFLTASALPLQYHLNGLIKERGLSLNTNGTIAYTAGNLFSPNAIRLSAGADKNPALVQLGRKLFFEKGLSGNGSRSCASCHRPENYFTDQLPKSVTFDGRSTVQRNAPTLFYCADQSAQFWDGRVKSLEEQIRMVLVNPLEMNGDPKRMLNLLHTTTEYAALFKHAFPKQTDSVITMQNMAIAIAGFLQTLSPFNSPFDLYVQGNKNALTRQQVKGFNLFMGKAQCGTCHFAPLFNGQVPPLYKRSELEVLGLTRNANFKKPELDSDSGRFASFPIEFYMGAFKTPTVRNVAKTAPYMHNGAFATLKEVVEFYNKGGGAGMGLKVPVQTLSPKPLKLKEEEVSSILAFLNSLTDTYDLKK